MSVLQARPAVSNLTILISCYVVGRLRLTLNHSELLDLLGVFIPTLICLEDRKWCSMIGSLLANQVAVGSENLSSLKVFSFPQNFEEPFVVGCIDIFWNHAQDNMTTS